MKNLYLLVFQIFLFFPNVEILSQEYGCSTPFAEPDLVLEKYLAGLHAPGPFYVKTYIHVIRRNDGSGGQSFSGVLESLSYLDSDYEPLNIFFAWDGCIDFIDSTQLFDFPNIGIFDINHHTDGIDIYLLDDSTGVIGRSTAAFHQNQTKTALMVGGTDDGVKIAKSHAVSHEMGHVLNLFHTWVGCSPNRLEALDGSNCETAGDLVCDTPADPGLANNFVNTSCDWVPAHFQINGQDLYAACQSSLLGPIPSSEIRNYRPLLKNIMNDFRPICYDFFTPGQGQRMRNAIAGIPVLQSVQTVPTVKNTCFCEENIEGKIEITNSQLISEDKRIAGEIIIRSGGVLTVSAELIFAQGKGITVEKGGKLIVEDGVLTKCPFSENWRGVIVEGNAVKEQLDMPGADDSGVIMTARARIEYAEIGIESVDGGLIISENTVFFKNETAVSLSNYSNFDNRSRFDKCNFICLNEGANLLNVYDVVFQNSIFSEAAKGGIVSLNAGFIVSDSCVFKNNNQGIHALQTGSRFRRAIHIEKSGFIENLIGVSAASVGDLNVLGCSYESNNIGLTIKGESYFLVKGNFFTNHHIGIWLRSTGYNDNKLNCNYYENYENAVLIWGNNGGLKFDFETFAPMTGGYAETSTNIWLQGFRNNPGEIYFSQQAENGRALSNQFSGKRKIVSSSNSIFGLTKEFSYLAPEGIHNAVYVPECSLNPPLKSDCIPNNYLLFFKGEPQSCFADNLKGRSLENCSEPNCLRDILIENKEEKVFKNLSQIDIDLVNKGTLGKSDISYLHKIISVDNIMSGYASGILFRATRSYFETKKEIQIKERPQPNYNNPSVEDYLVEKDSDNAEHQNEILKLIPNPAVDEVTVEIPIEFIDSRLQVISLLGKIIQDLPIVNDNRQRIDVGNLSGIYFVRLTNTSGKNLTGKLFVR